MATRSEIAQRGLKAIAGGLSGLFGRGSRSATASSLPRFDISNLPGMQLPAGPSSPFPRSTRPLSNIVGRLGTAVSPTGFLGKPRGPLGIAMGLGGLAVTAGAGKTLVDYLRGTGAAAPQIQFSTGGPSFAQQQMAIEREADALRRLYESPAFTQQLTAPNYAGTVAASNAQVKKNLEDYLTKVEGMGKETAKAVADAYGDLAKATADLGEQQQVRGQEIAADIDRLYQQLGLAEAELAAGGGVAAAPTAVSGLVPMGGEMATAQQTTPTYGASLADYLGREATIGGEALAQQALSQAAQGAGTATGLQNMIALASAQQRFAADQAAADRLAQAQMADAEAARQMEAMRMQMAQDQAARLFEAERVDAERRRTLLDVLSSARAEADVIWDGASGELKRTLERTYGKGPAGKANFRAAATENPNIITRITGE